MKFKLMHWNSYRHYAAMDPDAAELGRLLTAHGMAEDPEGRARVEAEYGTEFCKQRYPEAYRSGFGKILDKVRAIVPW